MKKAGIILCTILVIALACYFFVRFYFLQSKDFKPDLSKARSVLDLRPALIAKLQQLVHDGSGGLYKLSIEAVEPDIAASRVHVMGARLVVDSLVLKKMDSLQLAPDDIFKISFHKLQIDGIGISDLLSSKAINLTKITITDPGITVYSRLRNYNSKKRAQIDSLTLYRRLTAQVKSISIKNIEVIHGSYTARNLSIKNKDTKLDGISIRMNDLRIDSATQFDASRFFFAKTATISTGRFQRRTADSLYIIKIDSVSVAAEKKTLTVYNLAIKPRYNKGAFQKKLVHSIDRFDLRIPRIVFRKMNWWLLVNQQNLECNAVDIYNGYLHDYLDRSLPPRPTIKLANFPYQLISKLSLRLNIKKIHVHHFNLSYEEYFPPTAKSGTLYFDDINGQLTNVINIRKLIKPGMQTRLDATALLMHKVPMRGEVWI